MLSVNQLQCLVRGHPELNFLLRDNVVVGTIGLGAIPTLATFCRFLGQGLLMAIGRDVQHWLECQLRSVGGY